MVAVESKKEINYEKVPVNENNDIKEDGSKQAYGFGIRHIQSFLIFTSLLINFIARGHLGVTIVAMVDIPKNNTNDSEAMVILNNRDMTVNNNTEVIFDVNNTVHRDFETIDAFKENNVKGINGTEDDMSLNLAENKTSKSDANVWNVYRKYEWPKSVQEMVLSSFFVGYLIMMFPMGMIVQRWGGKLALQIALVINSLVSILTPWVVAWGGWKGICFCRILQGLSQAGLYPSAISLLAAWAPPSERASLTSYVFPGTTVGTVIAFQLSGFISSTSWGWPAMFWLTGILCIITFVLMTFLMSANPQSNRFISDQEKMYISGHLNAKVTKTGRVPWKKVLSSKYVWAIFAAHVGNGTTFFFIFTQVASYLHYILQVDVKKSGVLSSLPYIANFFASISVGLLSDFLTNRKILNLKTSRRLFNTVAALGLSVSLAAVSFTSSTVGAVAWLMLAMACHSGAHAGWMVNYMDISPNFSGSLAGTGNTMMNILIVSLPVLVSNVVTDVTNPYQWRIILFLVAGLGFLCNLVFVIWLSTDVQPWNEPESLNIEADEDEKEQELKDQLIVDQVVLLEPINVTTNKD